VKYIDDNLLNLLILLVSLLATLDGTQYNQQYFSSSLAKTFELST